MELKIIAVMIIMIVAVALIATVLGQNIDEDYNDVATAIASLSVPLGLMGILMAYLFDSKAPRGSCIICAGALGLIYAYILNYLYENEILLSPDLLGTDVTIGSLMAVTVIFWIIVGMLFEVTRH